MIVYLNNILIYIKNTSYSYLKAVKYIFEKL